MPRNRRDGFHRQKLFDAHAKLRVVDRSGDCLSVLAGDQRLGIEQVRLRRPSRHEQEDHAFGARFEMRRPHDERRGLRTCRIARHAVQR